jgi:DNA polymerase-1
MSHPFTQIWAVDFEFRAPPGETPDVVCMVARELMTGETIRLWGEELDRTLPPYGIGDDSLVLAYYASAEMNCHLALGWPMPANVIDLYPEFRNKSNGKVLTCGNGLLGALAYHGLDSITSLEKDEMRDLVLRGGEFTLDEKEAILDYCESDVLALERLFQVMGPELLESPILERALLRGAYAQSVARMEFLGIPIDTKTLADLRSNWTQIQDRLIADIDSAFGVYEGRTFKQAQFAVYLTTAGIPWPTTPTGRLALDDETFSDMCKSYPQMRPLKDLRHALGQLRLNDLAVGQDGRNRTMLSMFRATTGRNQPSTSKFVFGLPAWLRGLIQPSPGYGLAYIDWSQQEFGIAAALSCDKRMQEAYLSGDPYLAFAKQAGAVPWDATKSSHAREREQFKACVLAVQYGMGADSLSKRIGQPPAYAEALLRLHRKTYRTFWIWSDGVVDYATIHRKLWTVFGWTLNAQGKLNTRSLRNFPMQANGAEMLRLACIYATQAGIRVIAPVHDALLIEAPLNELDTATSAMQNFMQRASSAVLSGFELRSDAKTVVSPGRYEDERGTEMWQTVMGILSEIHGEEVDYAEAT